MDSKAIPTHVFDIATGSLTIFITNHTYRLIVLTVLYAKYFNVCNYTIC